MNYGDIARWSIVASSFAFAIVLVWGFRRFAVPAIASAQRAKNEEIAAAEDRLNEIKLRVDTLLRTAADTEVDAAAIRQRALEQARRERESAIAHAKEAGERLLRNASGELDRARAAARAKLRTELASSALQLARDEAVGYVDASQNARLVDGFMRFLEARAQN